MITREAARNYGRQMGLHPRDYDEESIMIDTIIAMKSQFCDNCTFDYCGCSVQDSILQVDPNATFDTFGCNSFEPKYRRTECAHAKQKNPF